MEDIFKNLEKQGKTDVDNLVKWMKESKLIDASKEQEMKARKLFQDAADLQHIELKKFKDVLAKIAAEQKKSVDQLSKQLAAEGPKIMSAALAGLDAFKKALEGK